MMLSPDVISENDFDLAKLIIKTLNLDLDPAEVTAETPIYQDGFGLDSIDILEVSLAISQKYGVKLKSDDKNNAEIFKNLGALSAYVQSHKVDR
jgi:acyl carrier protein